MSSIKQIFKNTVAGWFAILIRAITGLLLIPILIFELGTEAYGLLGIVAVIIGFSNAADLGLRGALGRELTEQVALKDKKAFSELISTALVLYLCIALLLAIFGWMLAPILIDFFKVSNNLKARAIWMIRIYGTGAIVFSFVTPAFTSGLTAYNRFDIVNSIHIVSSLASSVLLFFVVQIVPNPLVGWMGVMLATNACALIITIIIFRKYCNFLLSDLWSFSPKRINILFRLGKDLYLIQLAQTISDKSDPLVLSYFLSPIAVALYQPAFNLSNLFRPIVMTLTGQLYPLTTAYNAKGEVDKLRKIFCLGFKYTMLSGGLVSAGIFFYAEPFSRLWLYETLGNDYKIVAWVMRIFAIVDFLTYASGTQWPILLGMKKLVFLKYLLISTGFLNIGLSIYFVGYTEVGIVGVLYGALVSKAIRIVSLNIYTCQLLKLKISEYFRLYFVPSLYCTFLTCCFAWWVNQFYSGDSWLKFGGEIILTAFFWATCCVFIGLNRPERENIFSVIKQKLQISSELSPSNSKD